MDILRRIVTIRSLVYLEIQKNRCIRLLVTIFLDRSCIKIEIKIIERNLLVSNFDSSMCLLSNLKEDSQVVNKLCGLVSSTA